MLEKAGDKVTVKFGEGNRITGYYVAGKSFKPAKEAGDYTIILFTDRTGDYELQKIVKAGNAVKAVRGDKEISLEKISDEEYSIFVKRGTSEARVSIKSNGKNVYKLILDKKYVENYKIEVKAFAK